GRTAGPARARGVPRSEAERAREPDRASLQPQRTDRATAPRRSRRRACTRARLGAAGDRGRARLPTRLRPCTAARAHACLAARPTTAADGLCALRGGPRRPLRVDPPPAPPAHRARRKPCLGGPRPGARLGRAPGAVLRLGALAADPQARIETRPPPERGLD